MAALPTLQAQETFPAPGKYPATTTAVYPMGLDRTGSQPPPSPPTASTRHQPDRQPPMPSAGLTPPTPSRAPTPSSSSHPRQQCPPPSPEIRWGGEGGYRSPPPCGHTPTTPPRTPPHPPTRTRQRQARAAPPTTTGPDDMRRPHPTTRSHRSPPERPTAHTQASTHTHNRQAVSGPHTHAQPHRRDHHQPSHRQPTRHTQASHNHEAPTQEDTSSTTAARPAHNALTSRNTKHHAGEITENQKQKPRHPRE